MRRHPSWPPRPHQRRSAGRARAARYSPPPRDFVAIRVTVQQRQRAHVRRERFVRDEAGLGQGCVERRRRVALAENEAIARRTVRLARIHPQGMEEERRQDVCRRKIAARMAETSGVHHAKAGVANVPGSLRQVGRCRHARDYRRRTARAARCDTGCDGCETHPILAFEAVPAALSQRTTGFRDFEISCRILAITA